MVTRKTVLITGGAAALAVTAGVVLWSPWQADEPHDATVVVDGRDVRVTNPDESAGRSLTHLDIEGAAPPPEDGEKVAAGAEVQVTWFDPDAPVPEPTPAPELSDLTVGDVLPRDPGVLPDELAAYPVDEGQWLIIDTTIPAPDDVAEDITDRALALPVYDAESTDAARTEAIAAREVFAQNVHASTGRWPVLLQRERTSEGSEGGERWSIWLQYEDTRHTTHAGSLDAARAQVPVMTAQIAHPDDFHAPVVLEK